MAVEGRRIPHLPKSGRYPYFLYAVPKSATCAAFIKESRMEFLDANQLHRKYGIWGAPDPWHSTLLAAHIADTGLYWRRTTLVRFRAAKEDLIGNHGRSLLLHHRAARPSW
jgi:hypothetical protein